MLISYLYFFFLYIFYDQINLFLDYFILLSLANIIILLGVYVKKYTYSNMFLILISTILIDFISFNYLLSTFLIVIIPLIVINNFMSKYNIRHIYKSISSIIIVFTLYAIFHLDLYIRLGLTKILLIFIILFIGNIIFLKSNEFKFRY